MRFQFVRRSFSEQEARDDAIMRKFLIAATILVALAASASAKIYFEETFDKDLDGWVISNWKKNEGSAGKFEVSAGKFYNDAEADKGTFGAAARSCA